MNLFSYALIGWFFTQTPPALIGLDVKEMFEVVIANTLATPEPKFLFSWDQYHDDERLTNIFIFSKGRPIVKELDDGWEVRFAEVKE